MEQEREQPSSSDSCPICLSPILQESYLDQCFHKFCYNCILQWAKFVPSKHSPQQSFVKCPLCKPKDKGVHPPIGFVPIAKCSVPYVQGLIPNHIEPGVSLEAASLFLGVERKSSSVVYAYDGYSFQQHLINQDLDTSNFFTKAHKYRLQCYYVEPGNIIGDINIMRYWKSYKYRQPNQWLCSWVSREIQALIQEKDVDIIVHHILGVIDSWRRNEPKGCKILPELKQEEFKRMVADAAKPFLRGRTDRFVNELEMFVASALNIEAYDKVYVKHLGWKIPEINDGNDEEPEERDPLIPLLSFSDEDIDETA